MSFVLSVGVYAQKQHVAGTTKAPYPVSIFSGNWKFGHVQGIAVDKKHGYVYYSFTTVLVKTDMKGKLIGTVTGLLGHLGCLTFNEADGRVYGSIEYKSDEIGRGVLSMKNVEH